MRPLVIIPARSGSKGIPNKNIKILGGKPLIYYTVDLARSLFVDDIICVSTDSIEIKKCVELTGLTVPFLRPIELATDESGTYDVMKHAISYYISNGYTPDTIVLLQVTSPFRIKEHISEALNLYSQSVDMVVSVNATKVNPYYNLFEEDSSGFLRKSKTSIADRRQDCPTVWQINGSIYIINMQSLLKHISFESFSKILPYPIEQKYSLDIDTMTDWFYAEFLLKMSII